jgi:hypothetical protein
MQSIWFTAIKQQFKLQQKHTTAASTEAYNSSNKKRAQEAK